MDLDAIDAALAKMTPGPWHSEELVLEYETHGYDVTGHDGADLSGVRGMFDERPDAEGTVLLRNNAREMVAEIHRLRELCKGSDYMLTNFLSLATAMSYQPENEGMADFLPDIRQHRDRVRAASKGEL